jgi:hypothetical protein
LFQACGSIPVSRHHCAWLMPSACRVRFKRSAISSRLSGRVESLACHGRDRFKLLISLQSTLRLCWRSTRHVYRLRRMMIRDSEILDSAGAVIDAIGAARVRELTGASIASVSNWRASGRLPPRTVLILGQALAGLGLSASPSLWSVDEPASAR